MLDIFRIIAIGGLVAIIIASLTTKEKARGKQYLFFTIGGLCMLIYSIYIRDIIFIVLQAVFTISTIYELIKIKNK